mmetsp:Transcript_165488/g.531004  ORF Transcript_165488/g.531004 Transcript_165488/m.531004 type:complete len:226 (+) Transcript_165488:1327-2004(+)
MEQHQKGRVALADLPAERQEFVGPELADHRGEDLLRLPPEAFRAQQQRAVRGRHLKARGVGVVRQCSGGNEDAVQVVQSGREGVHSEVAVAGNPSHEPQGAPERRLEAPQQLATVAPPPVLQIGAFRHVRHVRLVRHIRHVCRVRTLASDRASRHVRHVHAAPCQSLFGGLHHEPGVYAQPTEAQPLAKSNLDIRGQLLQKGQGVHEAIMVEHATYQHEEPCELG